MTVILRDYQRDYEYYREPFDKAVSKATNIPIEYLRPKYNDPVVERLLEAYEDLMKENSELKDRITILSNKLSKIYGIITKEEY